MSFCANPKQKRICRHERPPIRDATAVRLTRVADGDSQGRRKSDEVQACLENIQWTRTAVYLENLSSQSYSRKSGSTNWYNQTARICCFKRVPQIRTRCAAKREWSQVFFVCQCDKSASKSTRAFIQAMYLIVMWWWKFFKFLFQKGKRE